MNSIVVSRDQLSIVKELAYCIWPSAYGTILSQEQLTYMLESFYSIPALEHLLLEQNQVFLLLEDNGQYIGFCAYELNCQQSRKTKLHKLYIQQNIQGKGVGKRVLLEVEEIAKQNNNTAVFLNVNRMNPALHFYEKMGYSIIEKVDIEIGNGYLMEDYVMEKYL
jgi:GNAT superfamily N-acetyltransferase